LPSVEIEAYRITNKKLMIRRKNSRMGLHQFKRGLKSMLYCLEKQPQNVKPTTDESKFFVVPRSEIRAVD
jgi:hypothetical protein